MPEEEVKHHFAHNKDIKLNIAIANYADDDKASIGSLDAEEAEELKREADSIA